MSCKLVSHEINKLLFSTLFSICSRGWSTQDVYICNDMEDAIEKASKIVKSCGPDGRKTQYALMEEFLEGDEFAVNLIASPTTPRGVQVTDMWIYHKVFMHGTMVNTLYRALYSLHQCN